MSFFNMGAAFFLSDADGVLWGIHHDGGLG
jgi:hypothetical protein